MKSQSSATSSKKSNIYTLIALAVIFANISCVFLFSNLGQNRHNIDGSDAVYDLSQVDFDNNESLYLTGNWEFYYNSLIVTDNIESPPISKYLKVPSSWSGVTKIDSEYKSGGYASYRCYIKNVLADELLTIYVPNIASAYRIFVNGKMVAASGTVSKNDADVWTEASQQIVPFSLEKGSEYEVVVEIAARNYSGLYMPVYMANYYHDVNYVNAMSALRFALCGIVFFCGLLFIILRHFVNANLYSIWLPVLSFVLFLRMVISTEGYIATQSLFFNTSYENMTVFIFISTFIIKLIALIYMVKCSKIRTSENSIVAFSAVFLFLAIAINFLPNSVFDVYYYAILQFCSIIIDIYIINKLCVQITEKVENSLLYLLSYLFIVSGLMIDSFYTTGLIEYRCSTYMPFCFFAYVVFTAIIHSLRVKKMYMYALQSEKLKNDLDNARMSIMLSQIQPHFLYNALNTIKSLIRRDPPKAEKAVIDFSLYLRGNMDSLSKADPVLFSEELDHIKYYCNIEQLRFSDKLDIFYEIGPDKFYVPTLSIQPIVENAIKHGVTKKPEGGSITISTDEDENNYYVIVEDDGVGFNVEEIWNNVDTSRSHVGIKNITERLEKIMGADVNIESNTGVGTKVTVCFPKITNVATLEESVAIMNKTNLFKEIDI